MLRSYAGASPALMGRCARRGVSLTFCTPTGRFPARSVGEENGNVLLRRMQYRAADDPAQSCRIARNMISITASCRAEIFRLPTAALSS